MRWEKQCRRQYEKKRAQKDIIRDPCPQQQESTDNGFVQEKDQYHQSNAQKAYQNIHIDPAPDVLKSKVSQTHISVESSENESNDDRIYSQSNQTAPPIHSAEYDMEYTAQSREIERIVMNKNVYQRITRVQDNETETGNNAKQRIYYPLFKRKIFKWQSDILQIYHLFILFNKLYNIFN